MNGIGSRWTQENIDLVTRLWLAGQSAAHIGRVTGKGKNAVIGKVHRLGLPARPSPIKQKQVVTACA